MRRIIGVRFLLNHNHFVQVALFQDEANEILRKFNAGGLPTIFAGISQPSQGTGPSVDFSVRSSDIMAIHTFDLELLMRQQSSPFINRSGI